MRIGLFTVHHTLGARMPVASPFIPFMVGCAEGPAPTGYLGDGVGMSLKTAGHPAERYGDLRAAFSVWKNCLNDYDIIGFQQYRRLYFFDTPSIRKNFPQTEAGLKILHRHPNYHLNIGNEGFGQYVDALEQASGEVVDLIVRLTNRGVIVNRRLLLDGSIEHHFHKVHPGCHLDVVKDILKSRGGRMADIATDLTTVTWAPFCNMYIARTAIFDQIITDVFDIMFEAEERILALPGGQQERSLAFVAERLLAALLVDIGVRAPDTHLIDVPVLSLVPDFGNDLVQSVGRVI
ncbi:uncharacterized protein DUF4422 [Azospirillum brasilense]|nr:uncharacterized protein DUF4422 [Azospirillum brasilense]